jgi:hypothetical protein
MQKEFLEQLLTDMYEGMLEGHEQFKQYESKDISELRR